LIGVNSPRFDIVKPRGVYPYKPRRPHPGVEEVGDPLEPDLPQPAGSAQGGTAGPFRLGPAARGLFAANPEVARPGPGARGGVGRPGPGGPRGRLPRGPPVRPAARGLVPGVAPAGDREQGPELPAAAPAAAGRRAGPGRRVPPAAVRPG